MEVARQETFEGIQDLVLMRVVATILDVEGMHSRNGPNTHVALTNASPSA